MSRRVSLQAEFCVIHIFFSNFRMSFDEDELNPVDNSEDYHEDHTEDNPWFGKTLEEFLYFCCPECDERNQSKEMFLKHALELHPKSKDLKSKNVKIKQEYNDDENDFGKSKGYYNDYEAVPLSSKLVKCEINEELDDDEITFDENIDEDDKNSIKKHKCKQCDKSFNRKYDLSHHIKHIHIRDISTLRQ